MDKLKLLRLFISKKVRKVRHLKNGYSKEQKYFIELSNGEKLLCKISNNINLFDLEREKKLLDNAIYHGVPSHKILEYGTLKNSKITYKIYNWIYGASLDESIVNLSKSNQYDIGIKAGKLLKKIHCINSEETFLIDTKYYSAIKSYCLEILIDYDNFDITPIMNYLLNFEVNTSNRISVLLHGDYHLGNLIQNSKRQLTVIDWSIDAIGDP